MSGFKVRLRSELLAELTLGKGHWRHRDVVSVSYTKKGKKDQ